MVPRLSQRWSENVNMIKKINFEELDLKGAFKIQPFYATDERGGFVKDYNIDVFKSNGIEHELKEVFYTCLLYTSPSPRD